MKHLFKVGVNVAGYIYPLPNISSKVYKYASKLKARVVDMIAKTCKQRVEIEEVSLQDAHEDHQKETLLESVGTGLESTPLGTHVTSDV